MPGKPVLATAVAGLLLLTAGCSGAGSTGGGSGDSADNTITALMVGNPQMEDIQKLTADNFTKQTGITVKFTILPENELRDKVTQDVANQGGQYDVATVGAYEVPIWAKNGWLHELSTQAQADTSYDAADLIKPMVDSVTGEDGKMYAAPFYGESSFLMYNKQMFEAKGLTMPEKPTWAQVADFAAKLNDKGKGVAGICLRGLPGWGELFAPLTTVVNTYGGTWFDKDWTPKVNSPEFTAATKFYVDLVRAHGENGAPQAGFTECLNNMVQGNTAMWYDATSAAGSLEADKSPVKGKIGYVAAPVDKTTSSGWLYAWSWSIQQASDKKDNAWKFISWASSRQYEELVGRQVGWSSVPAGKRASTYKNPDYLAVAQSFAAPTEAAISGADPRNPGVQPRPAIGIQFIDIPEFTDLGTQVSQYVSSAIAGQMSVEEALKRGQRLAEDVAERYQSREKG